MTQTGKEEKEKSCILVLVSLCKNLTALIVRRKTPLQLSPLHMNCQVASFQRCLYASSCTVLLYFSRYCKIINVFWWVCFLCIIWVTLLQYGAIWLIVLVGYLREDPLEKGMATHSSTLAWRIPWTEEPGGLQSMGLPIVGHDWVTKHTHKQIVLMNVLSKWN